MNSPFGEVFLFLTDLAWKSRVTIPMLITTAFLIMDIRLQIEINIQTGQMAAAEMDDINDYDDDDDDDDDDDEYLEGEDDIDEEYTTDSASDDDEDESIFCFQVESGGNRNTLNGTGTGGLAIVSI